MNKKSYILSKLNFFIPEDRNISYDHFLQTEHKEYYKENGYVIIKNIVPDEAIEIIINTYNIMAEMPDFHISDKFITSANYGKNAQNFVQNELKKVNDLIIPKIFNIDSIVTDLLNILVLKFANCNHTLLPHQDISMVDEFTAPTTFLWIPTLDIDKTNGSLLVLPKSHKWATWQRTHSQFESPIKKNMNTILEYMIPLYLNKGDLILFDSALIHASSPNLSNEIRISMNTSVVPKGCNLIHYLKDNTIAKNKIYKFNVDLDFWKQAMYANPLNVPEKYFPPIKEYLTCNFQLSKYNIHYLMRKHTMQG